MRDVEELLAAWRAAQALRDRAPVGTPEHRAAEEACREAAVAYQRHLAERAEQAKQLAAAG
jgi:hypothetical protein